MSERAFSLEHPAHIAPAGSPARAATAYLVRKQGLRIMGDYSCPSELVPRQAHSRLIHEYLREVPAQPDLLSFTARLSGGLMASVGIVPVPYTDSLAPYQPQALASFYVTPERDDRKELLANLIVATLGHAFRIAESGQGIWASVDSSDVTALEAHRAAGFDPIVEVIDPLSRIEHTDMLFSFEHLAGLCLQPQE